MLHAGTADTSTEIRIKKKPTDTAFQKIEASAETLN